MGYLNPFCLLSVSIHHLHFNIALQKLPFALIIIMKKMFAKYILLAVCSKNNHEIISLKYKFINSFSCNRTIYTTYPCFIISITFLVNALTNELMNKKNKKTRLFFRFWYRHDKRCFNVWKVWKCIWFFKEVSKA